MTSSHDTTGRSAQPADGRIVSLGEQLGDTRPGVRSYDFSNHARRIRPGPRRLTNAEVWEKVSRFFETGEIRHLPPQLRPEAAGILNVLLEAAARGKPPWPGPGPELGPEVPLAECARILMGDRADAESVFEDGAT
jgi:hypothetical protein